MKKEHTISMFDRLEKFKKLSPNVPEEKVRQYLSGLEEFLSSPSYTKTLAQIKP
jgi:hypothetical protein